MAVDAKKELLELDDPALVGDAMDGAVPSGTQLTPQARPTVIPAFDPSALAAQATEQREQARTITNEVELEEARLASIGSQAPPPRRRIDSLVEIEAAEAEVDDLDEDAQVTVLTARLMPLDRVPELVRPISELGGELEDPKAAYVAGFVDGLLPLETIVEVAGLPALDTLKILDRMISHGVAVFRSRISGI